MFKFLAANRADVALSTEITGAYWIKKLGLKKIKTLSPPLLKTYDYLYIHKKNKKFLKALESNLKEITKDGTLEKMREKYLPNL
ncbi:hypothetical protein [Halobacteriovorax marinus]|uniref:hypothetical protein n=1 Tax=Halobacteriovorax marinus TaxID=97084 RepID=UPI003A8FE480